MKFRFVIALLFLGGMEAWPQGQVLLNNRIPGLVVAPVFGIDPANPELAQHGNTAAGTPSGTQVYLGPPLQGQGFTAQLFGGPTNAAPGDLQPLTPATSFLTDLAGFIRPPDFPIVVPGVPQGTPAKLQLRVWDNDSGKVTNWQQVRTNTGLARGESLPFISRPLGSNIIVPPNIEGLQSFNLALPSGVAALLPEAPHDLQAVVVSDTEIALSWLDASTNELGFRIESSLDGIAFSSLAVAPSNAVMFSCTGLKPGIRHFFRIRSFNQAGQSAPSNVAFDSTRTPFAQWQLDQFGPAASTNVLARPGANPDGDGLPNFAEYSFGLAPLLADEHSPGEAFLERANNQTRLVLTFSRHKAAIDASFHAEVSSNLVTWQSGTNFVTGPLLLGENETTVTNQFRDNAAVGNFAQRYLRLAVTHRGVPDSWETNAPMPVELDEVACGIIGRRLYVVGGGDPGTFAFDLSTARWTNLAAARPFPGNHHAAEVFNGKLYLFGGLGGGSEGRVQIFDPENNQWSIGQPMPFAAGSSASAVIGTNILVAGGIVQGATTNSVARYNPAADTWSSLAPMLQGRNHAASGTDGLHFFVFGGRAGGNAVGNGSDTVQMFIPSNGAWLSSATPGSLAPLPQPRGGMGKAVFFKGEFYILGGETLNGLGATPERVYNRVDIYRPAANSWRQGTPMLTARHGIFPVLDGERIYVAGGGIQAGSSRSALLEVYVTPD